MDEIIGEMDFAVVMDYRERQNYNQNNPNSSRGRGDYGQHGYGNRGGNRHRGGNYHPQNRVFYAQAENIQVPQQLNVGVWLVRRE